MNMKNSFFLLLALIALCNHTNAAIYRVGYPGGATTGVDTTLTGAIARASSGDTIQLYQQYWTASQSAFVNKPLRFVGFGHSLDKNRGLQAITTADLYSVSLSFDTGSAGSRIAGIYASTITVRASNLSITRSRISSLQISNYGTLTGLTVGQCYIQNTVYENGSAAVSNVYFYNNIISGANMPSGSGMFVNNVVINTVNLLSFIVRNNIFTYTFGSPANQSNAYAYNLFAGNFSSTISGTGNQFNINMANTFANWNNGSIVVDSQLVLKTGSPAIGAGRNGANAAIDCGLFGGEPGEEYIISGLPAIPAIYELSAPTQTATGSTYNINISVRSQK
jgi:hypothetical protein